MIRVKIQLTEEGSPQTMEVSGHAGLAYAGNDIVCAAVSILVENLEFSLKDLLEIDPAINKSGGYFRAEWSKVLQSTGSNRAIEEDAELLFFSAMLGLKNLAGMFPDRIDFRVHEEV